MLGASPILVFMESLREGVLNQGGGRKPNHPLFSLVLPKVPIKSSLELLVNRGLRVSASVGLGFGVQGLGCQIERECKHWFPMPAFAGRRLLLSNPIGFVQQG